MITAAESRVRAFVGARVLQGRRLEPKSVVVENAKIVEVQPPDTALGSAELVDARGLVVAPGFFDTHVHGALGKNLMMGTSDAVGTVAHALAAQGVTSFVAATASVSLDGIERSLSALADLVDGADPGAARLLGTHLEGPFISPERAGVHRREFLRDPTPDALDRVIAASRGSMRICTIAPELPHGDAAIRRLAEAGIVPSIGHTDADYAATVRAIDLGVRRATHLWNAMPPLHHREPGPVPALLADPRVRVEIIADGHHLAPELLAAHFAGEPLAERMMLVSDGVDVSGLPDGEHRRWEGTRVTLREGVSRSRDGAIAGSTSTMLDGVRTLAAAGVDLGDALYAATTAPSDSLGMSHIGRVRAGADADLVLLDGDLHLRDVLVRGRSRHN